MKTSNFLLLICLFLFACGSSEPEKTAEEKAADKISNALSDLKKDLGETTKDMEGDLGDAISQISDAVKDINIEGASNKKPVNFRKLKELIPERVNGFERTKSGGESTGAMGFKVSTVEATFEKGDQRIEIDLVDAGGMGSAFMGMAAWSLIEVDKENESGFERTTTHKGHKAFEKCNNGRCEFSIFIAKRFLLTAKGRNVEIDDLHDIIDDIGIDELEDMKDTFGE